MDNLRKMGSEESDCINVKENYEVEYWAKRFNISPQRLREIIAITGTSVQAVEQYLKN